MRGSLRILGIVSGAAILAILAGGMFVGVQPQLASAATSDAATAALNAQNEATQVRLTALSKAAAKSDALNAQNLTLLKAMPEILKPNTFIRRVNEVAALDGVTVQSVSPGDAVAYTAPADATLALAKTDPLITPSNFAVVPMTVVVTGTSDALLQYAHDIQTDERVFLVTSVMTSKDETGSVTATLSGYIYTLKR